MISFQSFGPLFLKHIIKRLPGDNKKPLEEALDFIYKLNVSVFYIQGAFYHFSKRLLDIHYVKLKFLNFQISKFPDS